MKKNWKSYVGVALAVTMTAGVTVTPLRPYLQKLLLYHHRSMAVRLLEKADRLRSIIKVTEPRQKYG